VKEVKLRDVDGNVKKIIMNFKNNFLQKNPIAQCAKDQGGSGCVKEKPNGSWGVISNKTDKFWPQDYKDKETAAAALRGYHSK